ncbi:hypothetical protein [Dactylosporangium sp. CA-233914]|uniref:hypothetical protein n=1 Tax=Dactylosporangium sp. CA-233914 TaxID=3239934 RepID=UPI003D8DBB44
MSDLTDELARLERFLVELDRPVVANLLPGLDVTAIDSPLGELPQGVVEWFAWHNGVGGERGQTIEEASLIPDYMLISFEEALRQISVYAGDPVLGDFWLPIMENGGSDIYAAVWSPGSEARVARFIVGEDTEIDFENLVNMVRMFNACYDSGVYFVGDDGFIDIAGDRYEEIYARYALHA